MVGSSIILVDSFAAIIQIYIVIQLGRPHLFAAYARKQAVVISLDPLHENWNEKLTGRATCIRPPSGRQATEQEDQ